MLHMFRRLRTSVLFPCRKRIMHIFWRAQAKSLLAQKFIVSPHVSSLNARCLRPNPTACARYPRLVMPHRLLVLQHPSDAYAGLAVLGPAGAARSRQETLMCGKSRATRPACLPGLRQS